MNIYDFVGKEFMSHTPKKRDMKIFATYMSEKGITQNDISKMTEKDVRILIDDFFERHRKGEIFLQSIPKVKSPKFKDVSALRGNIFIFYNYLMLKHEKLCKSSATKSNILALGFDTRDKGIFYDIYDNFKNIESGSIDGIEGKYGLKSFLNKYLEVCVENKYKIFAIPVGLQTEKSNHQNILVFNLKYKTYELYDPHGESPEEFERKYFEECLKKALPDWHYIETNILCPITSFQTVENAQSEGLWNRKESKYNKKLEEKYAKIGFCQAWTAFYLDLRLTYPQYDPAWIQQKAIQKLEKGDMVKFIVSYIDFISKQYPEYYKQVTE